jgi:tetrapyrrole methylase family protein / MazG family protein
MPEAERMKGNQMRTGITLLGLGPGNPDLLTLKATKILENSQEVYLRTRMHPAVAGFPAHLIIHSFDNLYEDGDSFEQVYEQIVARVLELGKRSQGVVYGVPGHPFVAEATTTEIVKQARGLDIRVEVVEGMSFLEPVFSALQIDPLPQLTIMDALELAGRHHPSFPPSAGAIVAQIHSPGVASEVKLTLMGAYPDEHPVKLVHGAGTEQMVVEAVSLFEIDRSPHFGLLTSLYIPPLGENTSFESFQEVIAHLRAPEGCPWDREQTHQSLRPHLLEEVYEILAALDSENAVEICEEFGDLLLQIVLHAQIASEYGEFTMVDILKGIYDKIVRRHPHVFGDIEIADKEGVLVNWERLKAEEKEASGKENGSILDGVNVSLPALLQAETYQKRAARVGFDWPNLQGVQDKIEEEMEEASQAMAWRERQAEIGDLLFAVVNLARWYDVDAESALREANARFRERFTYIERRALGEGKKIEELSLEEMDAYWEEAKSGGRPGAHSQ